MSTKSKLEQNVLVSRDNGLHHNFTVVSHAAQLCCVTRQAEFEGCCP